MHSLCTRLCNDDAIRITVTEPSARYLRWFFFAGERANLSRKGGVLKISGIRAIKAAVLTPSHERNLCRVSLKLKKSAQSGSCWLEREKGAPLGANRECKREENCFFWLHIVKNKSVSFFSSLVVYWRKNRDSKVGKCYTRFRCEKIHSANSTGSIMNSFVSGM